MEESLARALSSRLDELGLHLKIPTTLAGLQPHEPVSATLVHNQGPTRYLALFSDEMTLSSLERKWTHHPQKAPLFILGPRATERSAEMFRQLGINFLDQAGNAYITFKGVHIDVRGRRLTTSAKSNLDTSRLPRGGVNLFSTKRAQVIFAILSWPQLLREPVRQLAHTAGTSLGQTQETLGLLEAEGFLDEHRSLIQHRQDRLIDQWTATYPAGLGARSKVRAFSGDFSSLRSSTFSAYVAGEAAIPGILRPETLTLFTVESPTELIREHRWRRTTENPNIFLRRQFWHGLHPEEPGIHTAPWLLTYAELMAANENRQLEAAHTVRMEHA
ncbi:type IV toxin-antitoxin system AbiEi family antitoxin [Arthrobacter woluwensis]|uniref:Transcriptional regulator, AbiEi antitoxin, Type IV TA system n=1 Tax=Arthrobacter woluwensis TaxID=156980 RepID=A0A1H4JLI7_9MICC|nr:type IV toxin-antitoxin system AbiEi family antitoxin [Arthrobacter woluwensis]SEB46825.1 hypothetical protein SAMN04489745_0242 [Arthrobacter woluwensis]